MTTEAIQAHFHELIRSRSLAQLIAETEAKIRAKPLLAKPRWLLFQLLCLTCNWQRALKQLPLAVEALVPRKSGVEGMADCYRQLILAEMAREEVFAGLKAPQFSGEAPPWAVQLVEALALEGAEQQEAADERRETALSSAPCLAGRTQKGAFTFISDADSRLGPILEFVQKGAYFWLPMSEVTSFFLPAPERLIDLIWAPVSIMTKQQQARQGHMPVRYPMLPAAEQQTKGPSDALLLGHETLWTEQGRTGTFGRGQKMWMYDDTHEHSGEWALRDIRECHFGDEVAVDEGGDTPEVHS